MQMHLDTVMSKLTSLVPRLPSCIQKLGDEITNLMGDLYTVNQIFPCTQLNRSESKPLHMYTKGLQADQVESVTHSSSSHGGV